MKYKTNKKIGYICIKYLYPTCLLQEGVKGEIQGQGCRLCQRAEALDPQFPAPEREGGRQQRAGVWLSIEHLPRMGRAPGSIPSAAKTKRDKKEKHTTG